MSCGAGSLESSREGVEQYHAYYDEDADDDHSDACGFAGFFMK